MQELLKKYEEELLKKMICPEHLEAIIEYLELKLQGESQAYLHITPDAIDNLKAKLNDLKKNSNHKKA